jgi:Cft2 family RNA processing exonuclease
MVESELKLVVHAVRDIFKEVKSDHRGRGRKPHDPVLLTALTYLMVRRGWSLRDAERWCKENMELLRQFGYDKPNPPSRMAFKRTLDSLDPAMIQRITAKVKHLKGEVRTLWF